MAGRVLVSLVLWAAWGAGLVALFWQADVSDRNLVAIVLIVSITAVVGTFFVWLGDIINRATARRRQPPPSSPPPS